MNYYSTNGQSPRVDFREAAIKGQAPDKGLYFPENIPMLEKSFLEGLNSMSKAEIGFRVIRPYVGNSIPEDELFRIVEETVNFEFPLVKIENNVYTLELFHGPTLAFKDVGARFMSRCLGYFSKGDERKLTVLVATSGDTGGAVANGFYNVDGVEVVILYPSGKVSSVQEKQLTTLGKNIRSLEVDGTFDDCQALVKKAFSDAELTSEMFLTSANSINVARWLPQQFYYFFAAAQWTKKDAPVISVPSGNFGNICAGLLANRSGLPVKHFIAACNANDVIPRFMNDGSYHPASTVQTISNAMDVGDPSNFSRILELFGKDLNAIRERMTSYSFSDEQTSAEIRAVLDEDDYLLDPHGAVGLLGLKRYLKEHPGAAGYFLETAHPVKFYDVVEEITGQSVEIPDSVRSILPLEKTSTKISADFEELKAELRKG